MTKVTLDISVIICAYTEKRWNDLVAALESVKRQTLSPHEIIVVVDYNPALLKMAQELLENVIVVENTGVRGLSGARNSGIAAATNEFIAFLDDDAIASSKWLMLLSQGFTHEQVLGFGGPIIPLWSKVKPGWLPEEFYWVVGCTYRGVPLTVSKIRNPIGANMCFRFEIFEKIGGFRSDIGRIGTLPMGCEETELCIRARQHWPQSDFLYLPEASVFHQVPASRTTWRYFCSRCYSEGLSKAIVTQYVGWKESLASERFYAYRTLPRGVLHGLIDALFHHDLTGLARAGAIITGLAVTASGYIVGTIYLRVLRSKKAGVTEIVCNAEARQSFSTRTGSW